MKASKFSEVQIALVLKQVENRTVIIEVCLEACILGGVPRDVT